VSPIVSPAGVHSASEHVSTGRALNASPFIPDSWLCPALVLFSKPPASASPLSARSSRPGNLEAAATVLGGAASPLFRTSRTDFSLQAIRFVTVLKRVQVVAWLMSTNMREAMTGYLEKPAGHSEKSAVTAVVRARDMLCDIAGQRGWNDTRESWLARGARKAGLSLRRARAIFYQEPIRLDADEYLRIEQAYSHARASMEALSILAGDAEARADRLAQGPGREALRRGEQADGAERPGAASTVR